LKEQLGPPELQPHEKYSEQHRPCTLAPRPPPPSSIHLSSPPDPSRRCVLRASEQLSRTSSTPGKSQRPGTWRNEMLFAAVLRSQQPRRRPACCTHICMRVCVHVCCKIKDAYGRPPTRRTLRGGYVGAASQWVYHTQPHLRLPAVVREQNKREALVECNASANRNRQAHGLLMDSRVITRIRRQGPAQRVCGGRA
jgi:hypothetical protein